jgi:hypothetical protein
MVLTSFTKCVHGQDEVPRLICPNSLLPRRSGAQSVVCTYLLLQSESRQKAQTVYRAPSQKQIAQGGRGGGEGRKRAKQISRMAFRGWAGDMCLCGARSPGIQNDQNDTNT